MKPKPISPQRRARTRFDVLVWRWRRAGAGVHVVGWTIGWGPYSN